MEWKRLLLVCLGGGVGSGLRYLVTVALPTRPGVGLPLGTLAVNLAGCFLLELVLAGVAPGRISTETRLLLGTGMLGGFTTYSSFNSETLALLRQGSPSGTGTALLYVLLTLSGGLVAGLLGALVGRSLFAALARG